MRYIIETIPHSSQRYETIGDYWTDPDGTVQIRVSDMGNTHDKYEFLVAIHELIEQKATEVAGISEKDITKFDIEFEFKRLRGSKDEPGDDPKAPYAPEHCLATGVERIVAAVLDVNWKQYEDKVNSI